MFSVRGLLCSMFIFRNLPQSTTFELYRCFQVRVSWCFWHILSAWCGAFHNWTNNCLRSNVVTLTGRGEGGWIAGTTEPAIECKSSLHGNGTEREPSQPGLNLQTDGIGAQRRLRCLSVTAVAGCGGKTMGCSFRLTAVMRSTTFLSQSVRFCRPVSSPAALHCRGLLRGWTSRSCHWKWRPAMCRVCQSFSPMFTMDLGYFCMDLHGNQKTYSLAWSKCDYGLVAHGNQLWFLARFE